MEKVFKKINFQVRIRQVAMTVLEDMNIKIGIKHGAKKLSTYDKTINSETKTCIFDQTFVMDTYLEWDAEDNKYKSKKLPLLVYKVLPGANADDESAPKCKMIGDAEMDVGLYANNPATTSDKLKIKNLKGLKGYIKILFAVYTEK